MNDTAIQAGPPRIPPVESRPVDTGAETRKKSLLRRIISPLASLRLTVVLFALSFILVFCGTLAQVDMSTWTAVDKYFRSIYVWIPFQLFIPRATRVGGGFPFPGGWLIGSALMVNLLAAHVTRFKLTWRRSGILLIHAGIIVMMASEFLTGIYAIEAKITLPVGDKANFVDVAREVELAFTSSHDAEKDNVVVIPESILRRGGLIRHDDLPVDVEVVEYFKNSAIDFLRDQATAVNDVVTTTTGLGFRLASAPESSGVGGGSDNMPAARLRFHKKGADTVLDEAFLSLWLYANATLRIYDFPMKQLAIENKSYTVELRNKRVYKPYTVHVKDFKHDLYPGTKIPRNFESEVRLVDPSAHVEREVHIYMNNPLRYAGETFYQSSFFPDDSGTVLQVVNNPAWTLPYISCVIVCLGMIIHFGLMLVSFQKRRAAQ